MAAITYQTSSLANSEELAKRAFNRLQTQEGNVFEGKLSDFKRKTLSEAYEIIESQNLKINQKLYYSLIKCIRKTDLVALRYFFEHTPKEINKELIRNVNFFNRIIIHGKKSLDFFDLAKLAFTEAKELNLAQQSTYWFFFKSSRKKWKI